MADPGRADPFAGDLDLSDFKPAPARARAAGKAAIREVSEANDFPSRAPESPRAVKPEPRRRRTGRNVQFNIKASADTIARFTALADARDVPFGQLLQQLVAAAGG